ncbi:MAG: valine--tRNA ligase [Pseudomonadota bacterium]
MTKEVFEKVYNSGEVETRWYAAWEKAGHFHVSNEDPREPFTIVIPPPNVTGSLHIGHALDNTLQDILVRFKRMDGFATLWLPGTDHAGIATQNVVERELEKEGIDRHKLGREKFVERVWQWKRESGGKIVFQLRRLGASCDWARERFTLDEGLSKAVRTVFVTLYNEGLIYRSSYLISWCPRCHTALSDLEVDHVDLNGALTYFHYETTDGRRVTMATTRPETMLGDTAIAVHPDDPRFRDLIGATIRHPFVDRTFPVVADEMVDRKFGTGAVKVTPAHDPNDYELGKKHKLEFITILDEAARMNSEAGPYRGMDRFEARKKVVSDLKARGLFEKTEPHRHAVGHCQRCKTIVEPRISEQWFVKIAPLAKPAMEAVRTGHTTFIPENWTKVYLDWMENIRDWCISRQLWWGHQIPVWYCSDCSEKTVAVETPSACRACGSKTITQDPDVLDTWFSSALWPFSTLGWPEKTKDLGKFYPTSVLVTSFDIIFFWVARMMMMGCKFMNDVPFHLVHIHALVRDEKGQKMSKSKGNVIDPLQVMEKYGTDAVRFALCSFAIQGRDIPVSEKRIEGYRNFVNKLWNAARLVSTLVESEGPAASEPESDTLADRWIRTRLNEVIASVRNAIEAMNFNVAADQLYHFIWHEFCDWYLEIVKQPGTDRATLLYVLDRILRLVHPVMPFITEEIWQRLPFDRKTPSIMLASYPADDGFRSDEAMGSFSLIQRAVEGLRNVRSENRIAPSRKLKAMARIAHGDRRVLEALKLHEGLIRTLAGLSGLEFDPRAAPKQAALAIVENVELLMPLEGLVDIAVEVDRLKKERMKAEKDCEFLERRLADGKYRANAPAELVAKDEGKLNEVRSRVEKIDRSLKLLGA